MEEVAAEARKAAMATEMRMAEERGRIMQIADNAAQRAEVAEARFSELAAAPAIKPKKKPGRPAKSAAPVEQSTAAV